VPGLRTQLAVSLRKALLRRGADASYADGDDRAWQSVDWASMHRTVKLFGRELNVLDSGGDGPVILWIHGLGANWQSWLLNIPAFMGTYRCVTLDLPGFGFSEMPDGPVSIDGYARVVDALCDHLGIERVSIVGNSMGGFIGADVVLHYPTRVERLVLVSAAGLSIEYLGREPLLSLARIWTVGSTRVAAVQDPIIKRPRLRRIALQAIVRYPERLSVPLTYELFQGAGKPGFVPALEALLSYSFRDRLENIEIPVLLVWGADDMLVPVEDAAEYQRLIGANARRVVFRDTGHVAMLERPSRFNALLADFLAGSPVPDRAVPGAEGEGGPADGVPGGGQQATPDRSPTGGGRPAAAARGSHVPAA
jgi:pimeloyl-ACP methyl ester carboxylesterase